MNTLLSKGFPPDTKKTLGPRNNILNNMVIFGNSPDLLYYTLQNTLLTKFFGVYSSIVHNKHFSHKNFNIGLSPIKQKIYLKGHRSSG